MTTRTCRTSDAICIRDATAVDAAAIQVIYAHHVMHGLGTFEEIPPDITEITGRREAVAAVGLPYIVAELDGASKDFAYATGYRDRAAYRYTVEDSIYVAVDAMGRGIGNMLLGTLITRCTALGYKFGRWVDTVMMSRALGDGENALPDD